MKKNARFRKFFRRSDKKKMQCADSRLSLKCPWTALISILWQTASSRLALPSHSSLVFSISVTSLSPQEENRAQVRSAQRPTFRKRFISLRTTNWHLLSVIWFSQLKRLHWALLASSLVVSIYFLFSAHSLLSKLCVSWWQYIRFVVSQFIWSLLFWKECYVMNRDVLWYYLQ